MVNTSSDIRIGIIDPNALVNQTVKPLKAFPNFKPVPHHDSKSDIADITKDLSVKVEVFMFTEYHLYAIAKQTMDFIIPVHHIPLMGTGLYRSLH